jgi:hypothetical protein
MYFFAQTFLTPITTSTAVGSWNVAGYQQINVHAWAQGATGPGSVIMKTYFDSLEAYSELLRFAAATPGAPNVTVLAKTYPAHAPTLSVVLYNPSTQMDFELRLYAACCEPPPGLLGRLFPIRRAEDGEPHRRLSQAVDIEALVSVPHQPEAGA